MNQLVLSTAILLSFISCQDSYISSVCQSPVDVANLTGEYSGTFLGDKYELTVTQLSTGTYELFANGDSEERTIISTCSINGSLYMESVTEDGYSLKSFKVNSNRLVIRELSFVQERLKQTAIPFTAKASPLATRDYLVVDNRNTSSVELVKTMKKDLLLRFRFKRK